MKRYSVILKCQLLETKTPHAAELCDPEVFSGGEIHRMLRFFVILKSEVNKKTPHAAELCDPEVCSGKTDAACCATF